MRERLKNQHKSVSAAHAERKRQTLMALGSDFTTANSASQESSKLVGGKRQRRRGANSSFGWQSIEGSFEQRRSQSQEEDWKLQSLKRLQALDLDNDDAFGEDNNEDLFLSVGAYEQDEERDGSSSNESSENEGIEEEEKRQPVYNQAGIDISEFLNKDYRKPVPLYRDATMKRLPKVEEDFSYSDTQNKFKMTTQTNNFSNNRLFNSGGASNKINN